MRGGITLAPFLLVFAYCLAIPVTIRHWRRASDRTTEADADRNAEPPWRIAFGLGITVLLLYLATLAPSTAMWDTSEYMTAAYTLGLPHPPGNPLFVLIGRVFSVLPIARDVAVRINLLAAICSAASASLWFVTIERVSSTWIERRWQRMALATLGTLAGATAFTVWNQSVVNEKVYTVSLVGLAIVSWLMVRWSAHPDGDESDRRLLLAAYLCGLGYANHIAGMIPVPAMFVAILARRPRTLLRWRLLLAGAGLMLLGMTPFATQPIRSAFNPPINEGEPTACRNGLALECTFSRGTLDAFLYNLNRSQYGKPELTDRQAPWTAQLGMWWLYFKWQWLRDAGDESPGLQLTVAMGFLAIIGLGGWVHFQRDRRTFWYFGSFVGILTVGLVFYLNFRYGASQAPRLDVPREVRDRDYFFLWSFSALSVWIALGLGVIWRGLMALLPVSPTRAALVTLPLLAAIPVVPFAGNWRSASRHGDRTTLAFAHDLLNSVEPYGVLVTGGDNDTFPLWYAQEVEGIRRDVTVAVLSLMNTDWFARSLVRRPIYTYDESRGPALYRGRTWPKPATPPLRMTLAEVDSLPQFVSLNTPVVFRAGGIETTIDPRNLEPDGAGGGILERADILVLRMITDAWPSRPIYISRTTGRFAQRIGLGEYVITRGLAQALVSSPESASTEVVRIEDDGWFDVSTSSLLWNDVYLGPAALVANGHWIDRPSLSTPFAYFVAGSYLARSLDHGGDSLSAARIYDTVRQLSTVMRLDRP
ncbi:MAG: hypothetical protein MNPFHGCM_02455 [Gemmatimonadaceae bacterium]|nr:hypothetical protein [Gemmatimonadaceae bacterium]